MKWGFPHFMYKGILGCMASFKHHCAFGFWKGALVFENIPGFKKREEQSDGAAWPHHNHCRPAREENPHSHALLKLSV